MSERNLPLTSNGVLDRSVINGGEVAWGSSVALCTPDPTSITEIASYDSTVDTPEALEIIDDVLLLVDADRRVLTWDISDPENITLEDTLTSFNDLENPAGVLAETDIGYVCSDYFTSIDTSDISNISVTQRLDAFGRQLNAGYLDLARDIAVVGEDVNGIHIIDISDPSSMSVLGSDDDGGTTSFVDTVTEDPTDLTEAFYFDASDGFRSFDVSDPNNPSVDQFLQDSNNFDVATSGIVDDNQVCYVSSRDLGVTSVDVSDPTNMTVLDTVSGINIPGESALSNDQQTLYLGDNGQDHVHSIDVSDPSNMSLISTFDKFNPGGIKLDESDDIKYLISPDNIVLIC